MKFSQSNFVFENIARRAKSVNIVCGGTHRVVFLHCERTTIARRAKSVNIVCGGTHRVVFPHCERTTIKMISFLFFHAFMLLIIYVCYRNLDLGEVLDCLLGIQTLLDPSSDQMNAS